MHFPGSGKFLNQIRRMTESGRWHIDRIALQRELEEKFIELGGRTYHHLCADEKESELRNDKYIMQLVTGISELENELDRLEQEKDSQRSV